jgi:hypothetical protein
LTDTDTGADPEPQDTGAEWVYTPSEAPHSKTHEVAVPSGFTVPFKTADVRVTWLAAPDVATGGDCDEPV